MSQFSWTEERSFVLARHGSSYAALCCCPADAGRMAVVRACFFLMLGFVTFQPPLLRAEEGVAPAARDLGRAVRDAGKAVGQGAKHVGRQTKGPAREVGHGFRDGAIAVGTAFATDSARAEPEMAGLQRAPDPCVCAPVPLRQRRPEPRRQHRRPCKPIRLRPQQSLQGRHRIDDQNTQSDGAG